MAKVGGEDGGSKETKGQAPTSEILGDGWGSAHNWEKCFTADVKPIFGETDFEYEFRKFTEYRCRACGCIFRHHYGFLPNIFSAMRFMGIPKQCERRGY